MNLDVYNIITTVLEINCQSMDYNDPNYKNLVNLLRNTFVVGSQVIQDKIDWPDDNDLDLFYYRHNKKKQRQEFNKLNNYISVKSLDDCLDIDLLPILSASNFYSNKEPDKSLTDCIFGSNKEIFTVSKGIIRMLNLKGFFLTKLASLSQREEERDYKALTIVYEEFGNQLPEDVDNAINEYGLNNYFDEFKNNYLTSGEKSN
ncbi:MAG: hypothetical protein WC307_04560 [Candidatus Nanoarchaeia archaeon]|jgi:hypothetical protein